MSDQDAPFVAALRALGVESPEAWLLEHLPGAIADAQREAKRWQDRYIGVRAALDGIMGDEFHARLGRLASLLKAKSHNAARSIDNGELDSEQEDFARGVEMAYLDAAALLAQYITVRVDGDRVTGAWMDDTVEMRREWRLTGQPDGNFPFYNHTFSDPERIRALQRIWSNIQSGKYDWTDAKLESRMVTVITSRWQNESEES